MAQNIVIILDITDRSDSNLGEESLFERGVECTKRIVERKIMSLEEVSIGIVLLGSNAMSGSEVLYELEKPSWKMIRNLPKVPSQSKGNLYDALKAANSLLAKKISMDQIFEQRIILISNLMETTNIDEKALEKILNKFKNNNIQIDVIGCETDLAREIAEATDGLTATIEVAMKEFIFYRKKYVKERSWNIDLNLGSIKIPVEIYKKNIEESILKEWKNINNLPSNKSKKTNVKKKTYYFNSENVNINSEELVKGYSYGNKLIPISKLDLSSVYNSGPEPLVIYGFTPSTNISWQNLNDNSMSYVLGAKGSRNAQITLKYIAQCLHELNLVGIARGVKKKEKSPRMYALMPVFDTNNFACLSMTSICYKEEIRYMAFPRISNKMEYSTEQVEGFKDLIAAMDLTDVHGDEAFKTGQTPNPSAQHSIDCIVHRANNPGVHLPQPNDAVLALFEAPIALQNNAKDSLAKLQSLFILNIVKKEQKDQSYLENNSVPMELMPSSNMEDNVRRKTYSIGTINPIDDYKTSLKLGKSLNDLAQEMIEAIESLIYSNLEEHITKALAALRFFRSECATGDPSYYNNWLKKFKLDLADSGRNDVIELINKNEIDFILKNENLLSDVDSKDFPMQAMDMETDFTHLKFSAKLEDMFD